MNNLTKTSLIAITSLLLVGCSQSTPKPQQCSIDGVDAPQWVCTPKSDHDLLAVGSSTASAVGYSFQIMEASAQARDGLARQVNLLVKNKIERFTSTTGHKYDTVDKVVTSVSKQISNLSLVNSHQIDMFETDKAIYVLMAVDKKFVADYTNHSINSSFGNNNALWQKFLSDEAQKGL